MTHVPESLSSRRTMSERALADAFTERGAAPGVQDVFLNSARRERVAAAAERYVTESDMRAILPHLLTPDELAQIQ